MSNPNILKTIAFSDFSLWDVKRFLKGQIESRYPIVRLGDYIIQNSQKFKLFEEPEKEFGILGVNNKTGVFDAYTEKGMNINQPYKKMKTDDLAYNPYRINVGSIGRKDQNHQHSYISPAYVVFSCNESLDSEFLYRMFKTDTFNQVINDNTTGSVRQNLKYDVLENLKIPLPSLTEQTRIVQNYNAKIAKAEEQEKQAVQLENSIEDYLFEQLGIEYKNEKSTNSFFKIVSFKSLDKWGVDFQNSSSITYTKAYPIKKVSELCDVSSGGTPPRSIKEYYEGDIPWIKTGEVLNDVINDTEEKITREAIKNSSAKLFPKDSLIVAMYGQGKTRGRTAKLGLECSTNQACAVLFNIDIKSVLTDYLWVYLINEYERLRALASGNNQPNLNAQMIKNYPVVIPTIKIQEDIVTTFFKKKNEIKTLKKRAITNREAAIRDFEKEIFNQ